MDKKIYIVGLGYGDEQSLSLGTLRKLQENRNIYLRTQAHPVVPWLHSEDISFHSFDSIYTSEGSFEKVYYQIVDQLFRVASISSEPVVYAVPGHPMVAERTTQLLLEKSKSKGVQVEICGGGSFLDISFSRLHIDPIEGFMFLDGSELEVSMLNPDVHLLLGQVYSRMVASDVKLSLMEVYPDEYLVHIVNSLGVQGEEEVVSLPLFELDRKEHFHNLTSVYVPKKEGISIR